MELPGNARLSLLSMLVLGCVGRIPPFPEVAGGDGKGGGNPLAPGAPDPARARPGGGGAPGSGGAPGGAGNGSGHVILPPPDRDAFQPEPMPGTTVVLPREPAAFLPEGPQPVPTGCLTAPGLYDVSAGNRRPPLPGLPDWRRAGYRAGRPLPRGGAIVAARDHGVIPDDDGDDTSALQAAVDAAGARARSYGNEVVVELPAGLIRLSRQITVDVNHLIIRGAGADPETGTAIVVRPDATMAYRRLSRDGSEPTFQEEESGDGNGGWIWPGRGAFRVQTRAVHPDYAEDHRKAPAHLADIFEGSVNAHWKAGMPVDQDTNLAGRRGESTLRLDRRGDARTLAPGMTIWVGAANTLKMYAEQGVDDPAYHTNIHMRVQLFTVVDVDADTRTVTLDSPLPFDVPANSTADGSAEIDGRTVVSKVVPLQMVENVGFEHFFMTYDLQGLPRLAGGAYDLHPADAQFNYGNLAPEYALHGIVFKWALNSWVRDVRLYMIGSHPVVTEVARNIQVEHSVFEGSWNKGKGGNGYLRGSRVWDSLFHGNVSRSLRHFTFQWSAANNVALGNDFDSDINFHGGWERHNLFELNVARVPSGHAPGNCRSNCGDLSGNLGRGQWYPLWWGPGAKAGKWSGATGPQNLLVNNLMAKQLTPDGPYEPYRPYTGAAPACDRILQLGWDRDSTAGSRWAPLARAGQPIADWLDNETTDFSTGENTGVNAELTAPAGSLFLLR